MPRKGHALRSATRAHQGSSKPMPRSKKAKTSSTKLRVCRAAFEPPPRKSASLPSDDASEATRLETRAGACSPPQHRSRGTAATSIADAGPHSASSAAESTNFASSH
eukprot:Amastigsp_a4534_10.p3 type:complete len:107 gc:universal Amastigsp_a4534_10:211-531(+)